MNIEKRDFNKETMYFIERKVDSFCVGQRPHDGYINATALCKACGKQLKHYLENKSTNDFLKELETSVGIPTDQLIQKIVTGINELRGTWVHPQVAINLGQWASPKFAVSVSKWVFEWMNGNVSTYKMPYHIRRYLINRDKIPPTHFSMLDQVTLRLLASLESNGYIMPDRLMPDISLGKIFSNWLRKKGYNPCSFPTYTHRFDDGRRPDVLARLYPNELMTPFNLKLDEWIRSKKAYKYFSERDEESIKALDKVYAKLPDLIEQ